VKFVLRIQDRLDDGADGLRIVDEAFGQLDAPRRAFFGVEVAQVIDCPHRSGNIAHLDYVLRDIPLGSAVKVPPHATGCERASILLHYGLAIRTFGGGLVGRMTISPSIWWCRTRIANPGVGL